MSFPLGVFLIFLLGLPIPAASSALYNDIEILDQEESALTFRYTALLESLAEDGGVGASVPPIGGCEYFADSGSVPLPVRVVILGVPSGSQPRIEVLSAEWSEIELRIEGLQRHQPSMPVELGPETTIRAQHLRPLRIYPLDYEANTAKLLRTIVVRVDFGLSPERTGQSELADDHDVFESIFSGLILNYSQARRWRTHRSEPALFRATDHIFARFAEWYRIGCPVSAIYKITAAQLSAAGLNLSALDPRTLRIFWAGGKPLGEPVGNSLPEYRELAILVRGEADGKFDADDYIVFYAPAASHYDYDSQAHALEYIHNHYAVENALFLTYGPGLSTSPARMEEVDVTPRASSATSVFACNDLLHVERNELLSAYNGIILDYYRWFWINDQDTSLFIDLPDLAGLASSIITLSYMGRNPRLKIQGFDPDSAQIGTDIARFWSDAFSSGLNRVQIQLDDNIRGDHYLDYLEILYLRRLQYRGGTLAFYGPPGEDYYRYRIGGITFDSSYLLLDVTELYAQKNLIGFAKSVEGRYLEFDYAHPYGGIERFALTETAALSTPSSLKKIALGELLNPGGSYDIVVVAPRDFSAALAAYRALREASGYDVFLASTEEIYAYFSGGLESPIAIRDFLKYAYENWPKPAPAFAFLVGDGTYDFLNNTGNAPPTYLPPYVVSSDSSISDENYVLFDKDGYLDSDSSYPLDRGPDMVISRWPVRTASETAQLLAKLAEYEARANVGSWQNLITYVADDERKPRSSYPEREHTEQSERLANLHTPRFVEQNKIYLVEYPLDSREEKPAARRDLLKAINSGSVLVNFIGHGNLRVWTDERVFRNEDLASLTNREKPCVIYTASCSIGEFDNPSEEGMAERLMRHTSGGAIAVVAATRLVYSSENAAFNDKTFDVLFAYPEYSLAEAVYVAKFLRQEAGGISANDRRFVVFGDPVMQIAFPDYRVRFDAEQLDSLAALQLVTLQGEISAADGQVLSDFEGTIEVSVYDDQQEKSYRIYYGDNPYDIKYKLPGQKIYRGQTAVSGGSFQLQFVVPKDISYGGQNARISAFAASSQGGQTAAGSLDSIHISGSISEITDTMPPEIAIRIGADSLQGGSLIPQGSTLEISLFDSSGINLSGEVGHRLELSLNDDPAYTYDLTEAFVYDAGSYQRGAAIFTLPEVPDGNYVLKVKAWDSANNSGLSQYEIAIGARQMPQILELFNVPNPFAGTTRFYYELSAAATQVRLEIFTLAGRKVYDWPNLTGRAGENLTDFWDGKDKWGDRLANGVYIYKLSVSAVSSATDNNNLEKFGKLVILR